MASTALDTLIEMGFSRNRAEKALAVTKNNGAQVAMDWLLEHGDDPDIDEPYVAPQGNVLGETGGPEGDDKPSADASESTTDKKANQPMSLKCEDCGKLLKSEIDVQAHAARTGHQNFSESTEEIKPLTEEEKKEQLARLEAKMKQRRLEKAEQEKKEAIEKEKMRRKQGQSLTSMKEKFEYEEMKKIAAEKKREKMEEKLARQRVKEQIARDRAVMAAQSSSSAAASQPMPAAVTTQTPAEPASKKEYSEARLQIRLPNGSAMTQTFGVSEQLAAVRVYVQLNRTDGNNDPFTLMTTFPRKVYTEEDMEKPLKELGLVPSAVLMVTKS
ncbi:UBX domain-containing protein 1-like [Ptychodera flava]|uniref:UBX domain-containing protein 1-like n=1 Tax=Ptychodera flava TaxID=63121 RepID=UPI00396AA38F